MKRAYLEFVVKMRVIITHNTAIYLRTTYPIGDDLTTKQILKYRSDMASYSRLRSLPPPFATAIVMKAGRERSEDVDVDLLAVFTFRLLFALRTKSSKGMLPL